MAKVTNHSWWCSFCGSKNTSRIRECIKCASNKNERFANVRAADRAVVYYNPATGEHRTPPRADMPIPEVYAQQGFERMEIDSMTQWERESGSVHEASTFNPGNEPVSQEKMPSLNKAAREAVANDIRDALASGPWTGHEAILNSPDVPHSEV